MLRLLKVFCLLPLIFISICVGAQSVAAQIVTIDTVFSFTPGDNTKFGQGQQYFPNNIFGMPSAKSRVDVPAATPEDVVSLGLDGMITVGSRVYGVQDSPGPDFVIFENAFRFGTDRIYVEPGKVSVSQFGAVWHDFPCAAATLNGCAGTEPSTGDFEPFDAMRSGGNSFDLADLGLEWIRYIRIVDVSRPVRDNSEHEFYDPTINGFELDAVVIIHPIDLVTDVSEAPGSPVVSPRMLFAGDRIEVDGLRANAQLEVFDLEGRLLRVEALTRGSATLEMRLQGGVYAVLLRRAGLVLARKLWLRN